MAAPNTSIKCGVYTFNDNEIGLIQSSLLQWYQKNKRDLPWRNTTIHEKNKHAYSVWVSEIMLQQTRVSTVIGYYNRWMKKWPTVSSLSSASHDEINKVWSGLGYYSRGKRLLEGAQKVVKNFGGEIPADSSSLMKNIPGVGRYTAAAIASIAFDENVGVLDGNVIRVLCRLRAIGGNTSSKEVNAHLWSLSNALVDRHHPGDFNQGMMELGALICTPKNPNCNSCPLKFCCKAFAKVEAYSSDAKEKLLSKNSRCIAEPIETADMDIKESKVSSKSAENKSIDDIENCADIFTLSYWNPALGVENYPQKFSKKAPRTESKIVLIIQLFVLNQQCSISDAWSKNQSKILMTKRPKSGLLANLWEFPTEDKEQFVKPAKKRKHCDTAPTSIDQVKVTKFCRKILDSVEVGSYTISQCDFVGEYLHKFSHIHQYSYVYSYKIVTSKKLSDVTVPVEIDYQWINVTEFGKLAKPTLTTNIYKLFRKAADTDESVNRIASNKAMKVIRSNQASIESFLKKK